MGVERLYTEYALSLPRHWTMVAAESEDGSGGVAGGGDGSGREGVKGGSGTGGLDDVFAAGGTTQASSWSCFSFFFLRTLVGSRSCLALRCVSVPL